MNDKDQTEKDNKHEYAGLFTDLCKQWHCCYYFYNIKSLVLHSEK